MMLTDQVINLREVITLKDGASVLVRVATPEDKQAFLDLFSPLRGEILSYLYDDVRNPAVIESWCNDLKHRLIFPLLALIGERVVGYAALHYRRGPERHIGEVRAFIAEDFRQTGLGNRMINYLIDLACQEQRLYMLVAKIPSDQSRAIRALIHLGFKFQYTFEDYCMLADGELRDIAFLSLKLRQNADDDYQPSTEVIL